MALIDFAIITALLEEFEAIKKVLPTLHEISENSSVWYRTIVTSNDKKRKYHVVVAFQSQMGAFEAIELTRNTIQKWQPGYIILTGIAGSFHSKVKLGDIIISQQIFHYDLGKAIEVKNKIQTEYRPQGYPCSIALIRQAEAVSLREKEWIKKAKAIARKKVLQLQKKNLNQNLKLQKELKAHNPGVHFGTIASGSLVVTSKKKREELLRLHGKILGTEMEGAGVLHATYNEELPTPAIVIKSISDAADSKKGALDKLGYWREIALENSSNFVLQLLTSGNFQSLNTDEFQLAVLSASPAIARDKIKESATPGQSFLAFPELIIPKGPLTGIKIEVIMKGLHDSVRILRLVAEFTNGRNKTQSITTKDNVLEITEPLLNKAIGIYVLISGEVKSISFKVETFSCKTEVLWQPKK